MTKILIVCKAWPELSQTYIRNEVRSLLEAGLNVAVLARRGALVPASDAPDVPFAVSADREEQLAFVARFAPDWVHAHYLTMAPLAAAAAGHAGTRFSVRTHSFDVLGLRRFRFPSPGWFRARLQQGHVGKYRKLSSASQALRDPACAGAFCFPFARPLLAEGFPELPLLEYFPLVDLGRFSPRPRSHDGSGGRISVCNVGAASSKKNMGEFLQLARRCPGIDFHLYAIGYESASLVADAAEIANLTVHLNTPSERMPAEYRRHDWLVYTADRRIGTVGWPMAVAEAQASGLGVCLPRLREDLRTYAGADALLYDSLEELPAVLSQVPAPASLERGAELARRCDRSRNTRSLVELCAGAA